MNIGYNGNELLSFMPQKNCRKPIFSIFIVSWNNLSCLQLCVESILKNSEFEHQILIHVNQGSDGTLDWVKKSGYAYTYSRENVGICYGMNGLSAMADSDYLVLIDDDNYVAPKWDYFLLREIEKAGTIYFAISSTRLEPYPSRDITAISSADFGTTPENFREKEFLNEFDSFPFADWNGSSWYPMVIHRYVWQMIGGLSVEFSPGIGSDPDFMMKLWQAGVRYFKGVSESRAYHFVAKTTGRVKRNNGRKQFVQKWGMNTSTFFKYFLRMGQNFDPAHDEEQARKKTGCKIMLDSLRSRF